MRTTLTIDDDLFLAAKRLSRAQTVSLGTVVSELMRRGLQRPVSASRDDGFPVFRVPPSARPITLADVQKLEDES
jgi:hypothetical protein